MCTKHHLNHHSYIDVFDMDGTLFINNITVEYGKWLFIKRHINIIIALLLGLIWVLFKSRLISFNILSTVSYHLIFTAKKEEKITSLFNTFLSENKHKYENKPIIQKLKEAQKKQHTTMLISRSPLFLVDLVAKQYQFTHCLGTTFSKNGKYITVHEINGIKKWNYLKKYLKKHTISPSQVSGYSDNIDDIVLLKNIGNGYFLIGSIWYSCAKRIVTN